MTNPLSKITIIQWVVMATADILIASILVPLNFYVALMFDSGGFCFRFWVLLGVIIFLNALTYLLGWIVSYLIYTSKTSH